VSPALSQHQTEIERNLQAWRGKPLLREIYSSFYEKIIGCIDRSIPGRIVEIGSGIGNLKNHIPEAIATDLFLNPWLDLVCDGYELPFVSESLSHLILFDVFHHLEAPNAFLKEAGRVLGPKGRLVLFEPFISLASHPIYGFLHHEPVAIRSKINVAPDFPRPRRYYAAQGNATRIFFGSGNVLDLKGWRCLGKEGLASFAYLFSGGFSKPAFYPRPLLPALLVFDRVLSRFPSMFGGRCLVNLEKQT